MRLKIIKLNFEAKCLQVVSKSSCGYIWCGTVGNKQDLESENWI